MPRPSLLDLGVRFSPHPAPDNLIWVESMEAIMPRTSLFNLGVRVSLHPAFDVLSLSTCSCAGVYGRTHVLLQDFPISSYYDFHLHDVDVRSLHL